MTKIKIAVQSMYRKAKITNAYQISSCLLLLVTTLVFSTCDRNNVGPDGGKAKATPVPVSIKGCVPYDSNNNELYTIRVYQSKGVDWTTDSNDYQITFDQKIVPFPVTLPNIPLPKNKTTHWPTNAVPVNCTSKGCYYKYNIYQGGTLCNDPGVLVQPG